MSSFRVRALAGLSLVAVLAALGGGPADAASRNKSRTEAGGSGPPLIVDSRRMDPREDLQHELTRSADFGEAAGLMREFAPVAYEAILAEYEVNYRELGRSQAGEKYVDAVYGLIVHQLWLTPAPELEAFIEARRPVMQMVARSAPNACNAITFSYGATFGVRPLSDDGSGAIARFRSARRTAFAAAAQRPVRRLPVDHAFLRSLELQLSQRGVDLSEMSKAFDDMRPYSEREQCRLMTAWIESMDALGADRAIRFFGPEAAAGEQSI
jgi:hypothetical protein